MLFDPKTLNPGYCFILVELAIDTLHWGGGALILGFEQPSMGAEGITESPGRKDDGLQWSIIYSQVFLISDLADLELMVY
ncbi:unnamed protein product [Prunus brigantina]